MSTSAQRMKTKARPVSVLMARLRCVGSPAIALRLSDIATKTKPVSVIAPCSDQKKEVRPLLGPIKVGGDHGRNCRATVIWVVRSESNGFGCSRGVFTIGRITSPMSSRDFEPLRFVVCNRDAGAPKRRGASLFRAPAMLRPGCCAGRLGQEGAAPSGCGRWWPLALVARVFFLVPEAVVEAAEQSAVLLGGQST